MFAFVFVLVSAEAVEAESRTAGFDRELERWVFSGALEAGLLGHAADGEFSGSELVGPRATNINTTRDDVSTVVAAESGSADVVSALVGGNFEVMTPGIQGLSTHPRFFMDVSILAPLASETSTARSGDPGQFALPSDLPTALPIAGERSLEGTGAEISTQHQAPQVYIGLGAALTFDIGEERIRIKPSVVYSRTETKVSAVAKRAVRVLNSDPIVGGVRVRSLDAYRLISLEDEFTEVYHGLGPALEIEYDTRNRIGPFQLSLYLKGGATHLFGDLETEFEASNPDEPGETVRWKYENDRWVYRAATGLRFRWVPRSMR